MGDESGLVVLVPAADPLVGSWRDELDVSASEGLGAHITLLYPFVAPARFAAEQVARRVGAVCDGAGPLEFVLDAVCWFGDEVVWLRPSPSGPLSDVSDALQVEFVQYPRFGGVHADVVVHLTVAARGPLERKQAAARAVAAGLPLRCTASEVCLVVRDPAAGRWRVGERFPLGG